MSAVFSLTIALGTPAMQSGDDVAGALRSAAAYIADHFDGTTLPDWAGNIIRDGNGNTCGKWEVTE